MKPISLYNSIVTIVFVSACTLGTDNKETSSEKHFDAARLGRITQVQQEMIDKQQVGSNHVVIYKDGQVIYDHMVNSGLKNDADITAKTIFPLWSMSKPITTVAAMILFEEGQFMMSDPIEKYLPEMADLKCLDKHGNIYPCQTSVTVLDLLAHQSGWGYYPSEINGKHVLITDSIYTDLEDFSKAVAAIPLQFEPGTRYLYGVNTSILGRLIEVISNQTLFGFMKERIFDPLEMEDTKFYLTKEDRSRFQPLHMPETGGANFYAYEYDELSYNQHSKVQLGGAGLVSTTKDYGRFCEMLLNAGIYQDKRIISPTSLEWMRMPINPELEAGTFVGCSTGLSFYNLTNPIKSGGLSPKGIFGWGGYHATLFWIDPENNLYGLVMDRSAQSARDMFIGVRTATYQALY